MIVGILCSCLVAVLFGLLYYRIEREQMRERLNKSENRLNNALVAVFKMERQSEHWKIVARECRQIRFLLVEELSEAKKKLAEKS